MWVDTRGEDSHQCIHDTPEGALTAQPPPSSSCRSLQYALQYALNSTSIIITCGRHEYLKMSDMVFPKHLWNVRIVGECTKNRPTVQCMNGGNIALHYLTNVEVSNLMIERHGTQGGYEMDSDNAVVDISYCANVRMKSIRVSIMASHGSGISLRHSSTNGEIILQNVSILHNGTYGSGIDCDILRTAQYDTDQLTLNMTHIVVANTNTNTTYEPSMTFTGISIAVHGTGNGNYISMHNITVINSAPVSGFGILARFSNDTHKNTAILAGVNVLDGWDKRYHSRQKDEVMRDCGRRQREMVSMPNASSAYSAIMIDVETSQNTINVTDLQVTTTSCAPNGSALAVYFKGLPKLNSIYLGNISVEAMGSTVAYRQGLDVRFSGRASKNEVLTQDIRVVNSKTESGGGARLLFTDYSIRNIVLLYRGTFANLSASKYGGGLCAVFQGHSHDNRIITMLMKLENNTAEVGGGIFTLLDDSSSRNSINTAHTNFNGNRAMDKGGLAKEMFRSRGGGFAALCLGNAQDNTVSLLQSMFTHNSAEQGGGVMLSLGDYTRGNRVIMSQVSIANSTAYAGGGLYINFHHSSERNLVTISMCIFLFNAIIPHKHFDTFGGGASIEFDAGQATSATNNVISVTFVYFMHNSAKRGVGGGLSVFYVHSPHIRSSGDKVILDNTWYWNNQAANGQGLALQSSPKYRKAVFDGITLRVTRFMSFHGMSFVVWSTNNITEYSFADLMLEIDTTLSNRVNTELQELFNKTMPELMRLVDPFLQVKTNTSMILLISVKVRIDRWLTCLCGAISQGIHAIDSEIAFLPNSFARISYCVASHGGAVALYGESYIRLPSSAPSRMLLDQNFAFQRGGALYVGSTQSAVSHFRCFLQNHQEQNHQRQMKGNANIMLANNTAKFEGQSIYISDAQSCLNNSALNQLIFADHVCLPLNSTRCTYQLYYFREREHERRFKECLALGIFHETEYCSESEKFLPVSQEFLLHPNHVDGAPDNQSAINVTFIPGIQKKLPFTRAYDRFGNVINTAFTVQIISQEEKPPVQLNPFSKYTTDFTVILHGVPLQHGMFNHSVITSTTINTTKTATLLVLQSVDNRDLLLVMNIKLQCCPPGYTFRHSSTDNGTCHCGMLTVTGIAECNESDPHDIGAVLQRDHWAGYLSSQDQHSCDGQKLFSAPCPPGFCRTQPTTLPNNNSKQLLEELVCGGSKRKGLLCGDCMEGNGIAVNFNGVRPVCTSCQEGLSNVGILVWILSEWVPMFIFMFIVMLFNIDLVSGSFNSFLLFAQLLAFSSIRGDDDLGPVHIAFVKIHRFLYGMWNLDFFSVLLPPYCLIPQAHLTLLQTLLLHYSIGLFPLGVTLTLTILERSAEKWICCHRVDQCLRRMRRWKAKYSDGMSYDRALPAFVILGFTRFLVSSAYILVNQTITGEDGEVKMVVWWQGSVPYGSIQHIAYFIPAIVILLVFVLLPSFLLLTLPIGPQLFGRLIIAVPALRHLQRMQTFCSNVYTDRWVYHFVNVFQGCYKEHLRSFSSLYLFYRIIALLAAVFIPRAEDALRVQLILTVALLLLIAVIQPYNSSRLNTLDSAILGNMVLIHILSQQIMDTDTLLAVKQFYASIRLILIYLPLMYPGILFGKKVYLKCTQLRCCQKQEECSEDNADPLLEHPTERLGNLINITELRAGLPTSNSSQDEDTESASQSEAL